MRHGISSRCGAVLGSLFLIVFVLAPGIAQAQLNWHAVVGAQSHDKARQALAFLPTELWVHAGDSITWTFDADDIHTVTFLRANQVRPPFPVGCPGFSGNPATFDGTTCVSTPPLVTGQAVTVNFPAAGNFKLVCLVHSDMTAVVHVLAPSEDLPHTQDFYDREAADLRRDLLTDHDKDNDHGHGRHHGEGHDNSVTAGTGEVSATAGGVSSLSVMRFVHSPIVIHKGETVDFDNEDPSTPHTITFGTEPLDPGPPAGSISHDPDGALHATINTPADSVHSGFIVAAPQDRIGLPQAPPGVTRFRVTFPKAGVFPYICALHDDLGMVGKVIVLP